MQKQINMKRCTTKREMNKQVFFFDVEKCVSKKVHWEVTHACKKGIFVFFLIQQEGETVVQEHWKWSTRKMSSRRRRSRTQMIKQKWKRKTEANAKRDEQKQKVIKKRCKKHLMKEKCFSWEFFFKKKKNNGRFSLENKNEIKQTKSLFVRKKKMLGLNGREWKKKKKRKISLGNFCEGEW